MKALPFAVKALPFTLCFLLVLVLLMPAPIGAQDFRERKSHEDVGFVEDDVKTEIRFGREVAARILGRYRLYEDEKLTRYVNLVGKTVAANAGRPEIEFHFGILRAEFVNAFAAPGGYVFITRGALDEVRDEAELAAVLAHEIAHVTERHIVKELNIRASDDSAVAGVARMIGATGDPAKVAFLKAADKAMDILMERGYKIEDEIEADRTGTIFLGLSGYDPAALKRYLERISREEPGSLSKTHPASAERIKRIAGVIETEGLGGDYPKGKKRFDAYRKK